MRGIENGFIVKTIRFCDEGKEYVFVERVRALRERGFEEYSKMIQLRLIEVFGDYHLNPFGLEKSDRAIFVLKK